MMQKPAAFSGTTQISIVLLAGTWQFSSSIRACSLVHCPILAVSDASLQVENVEPFSNILVMGWGGSLFFSTSLIWVVLLLEIVGFWMSDIALHNRRWRFLSDREENESLHILHTIPAWISGPVCLLVASTSPFFSSFSGLPFCCFSCRLCPISAVFDTSLQVITVELFSISWGRGRRGSLFSGLTMISTVLLAGTLQVSCRFSVWTLVHCPVAAVFDGSQIFHITKTMVYTTNIYRTV